METKPLLYGLIGFFIGGFIVSLAAVTFNKQTSVPANHGHDGSSHSGMSMSHMAALKGKTGDDYDKAYLADMISHHQDAVDMSKLSASNAKHPEIKQLSDSITAAQEKEIAQMKQWQIDWGYVQGNGR